MSLNPTTLNCAQCGDHFVYSPAEKVFRRDHHLATPVLCPTCRSAQRSLRYGDQRAAQESGDATDLTSPGGANRVRRRSGAADHHLPARSHPATCAACGAQTRVPFVPRADRPVYCRDCFNARRGR